MTRLFIAAIVSTIITHSAVAQFVGGIRFTNTTSYLAELRDDVIAQGSTNLIGFTPYVNFESRRLIVQTSFTRYFNNIQHQSDEYYVPGGNYFDKNRIKYKPSEWILTFGYKFNARRPLKIYPMLGITKYMLGIEEVLEYKTKKTVLHTQKNLFGVVWGLGISYTYQRLVFDGQMKYSYATDIEFNTLNLIYGVGVGYQIGKAPVYKERKKDRAKEENLLEK